MLFIFLLSVAPHSLAASGCPRVPSESSGHYSRALALAEKKDYKDGAPHLRTAQFLLRYQAPDGAIDDSELLIGQADFAYSRKLYRKSFNLRKNLYLSTVSRICK